MSQQFYQSNHMQHTIEKYTSTIHPFTLDDKPAPVRAVVGHRALSFFAGIRSILRAACLLVALVLGVQVGWGQTITYSTPGTTTWIAPAGVTQVTVQAWGAGGGGSSINSAAAGGGGGGAFTQGTFTGLVGGNAVSITVGLGGTAGVPTVVPGNFSRSIFGANTITANGGLSTNSTIGGAGGAAVAIGGIISASYAGGNGGNAAPTNSGNNNEAGGGGGGSATTNGIGITNGSNGGGSNVATPGGTGYGTGGQGAGANGTVDATAGGIGAGGGGRGEGASTSKAGGNGQIILSFACPSYTILPSSITSTTICNGTTSAITVNNLPQGNFVVTYNLGAPNAATGLTATMTVNASGTGTFNTPVLNNSGATLITITQLASEVTAPSSGCVSAISANNTATIQVDPTSIGGSVSSNQTVCSGGTPLANLTLSGQTGGVIGWQRSTLADFSSFTPITNLTPTLTTTEIGALTQTTYFRAIIQSGVCTAVPSAAATIFVNNVTAGVIAGNQTICNGGNPAIFTIPTAATGTGNLTYQWQSSTVADFSSNVSTIPGPEGIGVTYDPPGGLSQTTYFRRIAISTLNSVPCSDTSNIITVTVDPLPVATAGGSQSICLYETATVSGATANFGTIMWSHDGDGSLTNATTLTPTYTPVFADLGSTVTLTMTVTSNNACTPQTTPALFTVVVNALPPANAGTDQTICQAGSATLNANNPAPAGTGAWTILAGSPNTSTAQLSSTTAHNASFSPTQPGVYTLRWTTSNASCSTQDDVVISADAVPTTANAGPNQTICQTATATLAANASGQWTIASGPSLLLSQFNNAAIPNAVFTPAGGPGVYVLTWTTTNGLCNSTSDVTITVSATATVANAGSNQTICETGTATLAANNPLVGTGLWSIQTGSPNTAISQISVPGSPGAVFSPTQPGSYTLIWTITNGACNSSSNVTINVDQSPTVANAGTNQTTCQLAPITLGANSPVVGTGVWTIISGPNTNIGQISNTSAHNTLFTPNAPNGGTYVLQWTITNGVCAASTSQVTITVNPVPTVLIAASPNGVICAGTNVVFTLTPFNEGTPTYQWKLNGANVGTGSTTYPNNSLANGDKVWVVMTTVGTCPTTVTATSNEITMAVNPTIMPSVNITPGVVDNICAGATVTFTANVTNGGTSPGYQWYLNDVLVPTATAQQYAPTLVNGDRVKVEVTSNANCPLPATVPSTEVVVSTLPPVPAAPVANAGTNALCSQITANWTASANATSYLLDVSTDAAFGSFVTGFNGQNVGNVITYNVSGLLAGVTYYYRVRASNSCGTSANSGSITFATLPATPSAPVSDPGTLLACTSFTANWQAATNATSYRLDVATDNGFTSIVTGYGNLDVGNVTTYPISGLLAGTTYYYRVRAANTCGISGNAAIQIIATLPATPPIPASSNATGIDCQQFVANWTASANATGYRLDVSTDAGFASFVSGYQDLDVAAVTNYTVTGLTEGTTYYYRVRATNSCGTSGSSTVRNLVTPPPTPAIPTASAATAIGCTQFTANWSATPGTANYYLDVATDMAFTAMVINDQNVGNVTSFLAGSLMAGNTYYYRVRAGNSCGLSNNSNIITVVMLPATPAVPAATPGTGATCTQITANWDASPNATKYYLDVSTVNTFASYLTGYQNRDVGNATTLNVTGLTAGVTYYYRVRAENSCGLSTSSGTITYATLPATPSAPVATAGTAATCDGITANWNASANATSYLLDVSTVNTFLTFVPGYNGLDVGNVLTYNVTGLTVATTYYYRVRAVNICGTSTNSNVITYSTLPATPAQPGAITGPANVCINSTGLVFSVAAVPNATSYNWTLPSGFSIALGANTNSITVSTSGVAVSGNITVSSVNTCGTSAATTMAIVMSTAIPATPGPITGATVICPVKNLTYSVANDPGATNYNWIVPATGWSINSGSGTNSINTTISTSGVSGNITVSASNGCGVSALRSLAVSVSATIDVSAGPDQIVCQGTTSVQLNGFLNGFNNANQWDWEFPDGGTLPGTGNPGNTLDPTYQFPNGFTNGTLRVVLTSVGTIAACGGQRVSDTMQVIVLPHPTATIAVVGNNTICLGSSATVRITATPNTVVRYNTNQTINVGATGIAEITQNFPSTTTFTINGVARTSPVCAEQSASGSVAITVITPSAAPTSLSASVNPICSGTSTTLTQTGGSLGTNAIWRWYSDDTYSTLVGAGSGANASITVSPTTATTYYLRIENQASPCPNNIPGGSITINVNNPSSTPTALAASVAPVCNGGSTTLTQSGGSLGTNAKWRWYSNNSYTTLVGEGIGANASLTVNPIVTTTYYLRIEDQSSPCANNINGPAAGVTVVVSNPSVAATGLIATPATICSGSPTTLTQTGGSLGTGAAWRWYTDPAFAPASLAGSGSGANASLVVNPTANTTYYLRIEDQAGPCTNPVPGPGAGVLVTVNQPSVVPSALVADVTTICAGTSVTLTQTGGALGTNATWNWYSDPAFSNFIGSTNSANASLIVSPTATTTYYLRIEDQSAPCNNDIAVPGSVTITVNNPSVAPSGLATSASPICAGSSATLTQTGGNLGTNAIWRWYSDAGYNTLVGSGTGTDASLSVSPSATTTYYLRIEQTASPCTQTVNAAGNITIVVNDPSVAPTSLLATASAICAGQSTVLSQTGGILGNGAIWRWYSDASYSTLVGSTSAADAELSVSPTVNTTYYLRAEGTNAPCATTVAGPGSGVTITVNIAPSIGTQPANDAACVSQPASFSVVANGDVTGYQWYKKNPTPPDATVGTNSSTFNIAAAQLTDAGEYYVVVSGSAACGSVPSSIATLVVNEAITITNQPDAQTVCENGPVTFTVEANAGSAPLTYQWRHNGINIGGPIGDTYTIPNVTFANAGNYDVVVIGPSGFACSNLTSSVAILTINPRPIATIAASAPDACVNDALSVTFTGSNSTRPYTFHYTEDGVSKTATTSGGSDAVVLDLSAYAPGSYTFILNKVTDQASTLCERDITGQSVTVTVKPRPVLTATPATEEICSGSTTSIALSSNLGATNYSWVVQSSTGVSGMLAGNGNNISQELSTTGPAAGTVVYRITPSENGCTGNYVDATITVNPIPNVTANPASQEICSFQATNIALTSNVSGTSFAWTMTPNLVSGNALGSGTPILQALQTTSSAQGTATYSITPTFAGCDGIAETVIVKVNPLPQGTILADISGTITVCLNTTPGPDITFTGSNGSSPFEFTYLQTGIVGSQTTATISGNVRIIPGRTDSVGAIVYTLVGVRDGNLIGGCPQAVVPQQSATVTVRELPTATFTAIPPVCIGAPSPNLVITGANGSPNFTFTYSIDGVSQGTVVSSGNTATLNPPTGTAGSFTYAITNVQEGSVYGCQQPVSVATAVVVRPNATVALASATGTDAQTICVGIEMTDPIIYQISGSGTGATVTGLPGGVSGTYNTSTNQFTISGTPAVSGTFNYTVSVTGLCGPTSIPGTITIDPSPQGGTATSSAGGLSCSPTNSGTITLSGQTGTIKRWEISTNGGITWTTLGSVGIANPIPYNNVAQTTIYRAVVESGVCTAEAVSIGAMVNVIPNVVPTTNPSPQVTICAGQSVNLSANAGIQQGNLTGGLFESANPTGWRITENGTVVNFPADANNSVTNPFSQTNGPKDINGIIFNNQAPLDGRFAVASGQVVTTMETPVFSLIGLTSAQLSFYHALILNATSSARIEISLDGGATYINVLAQWNSLTTLGNPNLNFQQTFIDLAAYLGQPEVRIKFTFSSNSLNSNWAIDNITAPSTIVPINYVWSPAAGLNTTTGTPVIASPTTTTTYTVTTTIGGCLLGSRNVTVNVNPLPTLSALAAPAPVCNATNVAIALEGLLPNSNFTVTYNIGGGAPINGTVVSNLGGFGTLNVPVTTANNGQTLTITSIVNNSVTPGCAANPNISVTLILPASLTAVISGGGVLCPPNTGSVTISVSGNGPFTGNITNGTTTTAFSGTAPTTVTVSNLGIGSYTISSLQNTANGCNSTVGQLTGTAVFSYPAGLPGTWTGAFDTNWFDCRNWSGGIIPDATTDVTLPAAAARNCHIDATLGGPALAMSITIEKPFVFLNAGLLHLYGTWTDNLPASFVPGNGTVVFMGGIAQFINTTAAEETFFNLTVTNGLGGANDAVILNDAVRVTGNLALNNGRMLTTNTNILSIEAGGTTTGGSDASYVNGPMIRRMNAVGDYIFPIGKPGKAAPYVPFRPARVLPVSATASGFKAEYFITAAPAPALTATGDNIVGILNEEYWQIDRISGSDARIVLYYINPNQDPHWTSLGPGGTTNHVAIVKPFGALWYFTRGTDFSQFFSATDPEFRVWTDGAVTPIGQPIFSKPLNAFSPFTFGHSFDVVLPIRLLSFAGVLQQDNALLQWSVANNDEVEAFEVEHSTNGTNFKRIGSVPKGSTPAYRFTHFGLTPGPNYYRLLMKGKDGSRIYSAVVLLVYGKPVTVITGLKTTLVRDELQVGINSAKAQNVNVRLIDMAGRVIWSEKSTLHQGPNSVRLSTLMIASGMYHVQVATEDGVWGTLKFLKE